MRRPLLALSLSVVTTLLAGTASADPEASLGANAGVPPKPGFFRYGNNFGYTPGWTNPQKAQISHALSSTTTRIALSQAFVKKWGNDILTGNGDVAGYAESGMADLTCFLQNDTAESPPTDLDQPIWSSPGIVNEGNSWAVFVRDVVTNYKSTVKVWEVWNEPDFTTNFDATQKDWWTMPPAPGDLQNWHAPIYAYVRILRITYEVAKSIDPGCIIAVGGLGYESFLDAVLRYTDEPKSGAITSDNPAHGGAWFDAVSFHHYPMYATYDDATMTWSKDNDSDVWADGFLTAKKNFQGSLSAHGYDGATYPQKLWLSTETGVSTKVVGTNFGGTDVQKNYLAKVAIVGAANDVFQIHWFDLADGEADAMASDPYAHMGLYYAIEGQSPATAMAKPTSAAYATASSMLDGVTFDAAATSALGLQAAARGYVFRLPDGRKRLALWARASGNDETATTTISLPTTVPLSRATWDAAITMKADQLTPSGGAISLDLDASPVWLTETTASSPMGGGGATGVGGGSGDTGGASNGGASAMGTGGANGGSTTASGGSAHGGVSGHGGASAVGGAHGGSMSTAGGAATTAGGSSGASATAPAASDAGSGDSGGCGCRTSGRTTGSGSVALLVLLAAAAQRRRRRPEEDSSAPLRSCGS